MKEKKHQIHSRNRNFNQSDVLDQLVAEEWQQMIKENPDYVEEVEDLTELIKEVRNELLLKEYEEMQKFEEELLEEQIRSFEMQRMDEDFEKVKIEQSSQESQME